MDRSEPAKYGKILGIEMQANPKQSYLFDPKTGHKKPQPSKKQKDTQKFWAGGIEQTLLNLENERYLWWFCRKRLILNKLTSKTACGPTGKLQEMKKIQICRL